ncbi:uncharacterized protein PgNI_12340 [Pyricularia grisea]|uniref:Protein kinase domain-containing protein n=1 Tax=Pyricularia grisea TaxID=148305 RepID=A0A6P8AMX7_PYRGI|nr:uncharacterized protein PgNI_12340 [Pyricularia grisea]TLD03390.1 hypothetical protein PgNI_12340 [Pyricularia grisea]
MDAVLDSWITSTKDDECELIVRSPGAVFYLQWRPSELKDAQLVADFYKFLTILKSDDDSDDHEEAGDHKQSVAEKLKQPFDAVVSALAPQPPKPPFTLHHWVYPEWFSLVATGEGNRILPRRDDKNPRMPPGQPRQSMQGLELDKWVPKWYSSHEVQIIPEPRKPPLLSTPSKVLVEGKTCHFKGSKPLATFRELETFRNIADALATNRISPDTRISRLHGLVCDRNASNQERIVGLLLVYIEPKITTAPSTLANAAWSASKETLQRWVTELATLVLTLHNAGILWGDAKPDNVLVDKNDNLWLTDFDGGYTPPWRPGRARATSSGLNVCQGYVYGGK